jgi:hypothetical protein
LRTWIGEVGSSDSTGSAGRSINSELTGVCIVERRSVRQSANARCPDTSSLRSITAATQRRVPQTIMVGKVVVRRLFKIDHARCVALCITRAVELNVT